MDAQEQLNREAWRIAVGTAGDYGKWLVASLTLVHAGAIYGLASSEHYRNLLGTEVLWWFVAGLIFSLLCGFLAWVNWSFLAELKWRWPQPSRAYSVGLWVAFWASLASGFASGSCILLGALAVSRATGTS